MKKNEESLITYVIPENFIDTGRCFNGMFRTRNLLEGIVLAGPIAYLLAHTNLETNQKIILIAIIAGGLFLGCINGINGDSLFEFIIHAFNYKEKKRVAKYNSRVKFEASPQYLTKNDKEVPRDKIMRVVENFNIEEEDISRDVYDPIKKEVFEDDLDVLEKPDDLKSKKELRKEAKIRKTEEKNRKKAEKEKIKANKIAEKEARKAGGKRG